MHSASGGIRALVNVDRLVCLVVFMLVRLTAPPASNPFLHAMLFHWTYAKHRMRCGMRHTAARAGRGLCRCVANGRLRHRLIGYARVSKADGSQSLDLQHDALRAAGVDAGHVYHDHGLLAR